MHDPASLELSADEMLAMGHNVLGRVVAHIASLDEQPARGDLEGIEQLVASLRQPPPEHGSDLDELLDPLFDEWIPRSFNAPGPGYLAYVPGGGLYPTALADLIADGVNRYTGVWNAAPLLIQLEANVLDWFREWMQMPAPTRGLLTSGGSMATFTAIFTAREERLGSDLRDGVLYASAQAHHCVAKAAKLAGILEDRVRVVATDERLRMDTEALSAAIAADRRAGLRPFMVASAAGTTNTGAVDPLDAIADVCEREQLWHHVDGAYGGFFFMCPALRPQLAGLSRADSLVLDPHKGLFLPYGTGALLVRDGQALVRAHQVTAGYMPPIPDGDLYNPCQYGPELSRPYRGLRVWLPLMLFGAARFRAALQEKRDLAVRAHERLRANEHIAIFDEPELSLFAFHVTWDGATVAQQNAATAELLERVTARGRAMITGTRIGGRFFARICVLCFRTRERHIDACVEDIELAISELVPQSD